MVKKILMVVLCFAVTFLPAANVFAVDYGSATNPNALAVDPDAVVNLTNAPAETTVTVNDDVNLANVAGVTTAIGGQGILTLAGTSTITGPVGTSEAGLSTVNAGIAGETATFSSDIYATTFNVTGTGDVVLNGNFTGALDFDNTADGTVEVATGQNIIGAVTATTAGEGTLTLTGTHTVGGLIGVVGANELAAVNINTGTTTSSYDIAATNIDINATGTLALGSDIATEGILATAVADGSTIDLNGYTLDHTGTITFGAASDLNLEVASATSYGNIVSDGDVTIAGATDMDVAVTGYLADGSALTVINSSGGGGAIAVLPTVTDDSVMGSFAASTADTNDDLVLTYTRDNTYNSVATTPNATEAGAALEDAGATNATGDMVEVLSALDTLDSTTDVAAAIEQTTPSVNMGSVQTVLNAIRQGVNAISNRLTDVRTGMNTGATGQSYGGEDYENSIWAQGYAAFDKQDTRDGIRGYDSNMYGTSVGFDNSVGENLTVGIAGGYAYTDVNNKQNNIGDTDINSFQGSLYAGYDEGPWFIDGVFTFAWNNYDASRSIVFGGINRQADADYDGQQYSGYLAGGYTFDYDGLEMTPIVSLRYVYLYIDSYDETGAGALNLSVSSQDYNLLESGLGGKLEYPMETENIRFIPEVHAMWFYDYIGDRIKNTARFSGGGSTFSVTGVDPAQHSFNAGAKITFELQDNVDLVFDYDFDVKEDYHSHMGGATVKYYF